jgi:polyisoprenoid-binding protein YceI
MSAPPVKNWRARLPVIVAGVIVAALLLAVAGVLYMFSGSAPAAVTLDSLPPAVGPSEAAASPGVSASTSAGPTAASSGTSAATSGGIDGTWNVDTTIGSFSDFSDSFVGYRVHENLSQVGSTTAVGRTPKVSGSLTISGTTVTAAKITADLTALQSDRSMRDGQLRQQALQTNQFPSATFELTTPIQLPGVPTDGQTMNVTAQGRLTLHGVTKDVSIPLQAKLSGSVVTVVGSLPIVFADYGISSPQSMLVLSVDDHGTMELQLHFTRA